MNDPDDVTDAARQIAEADGPPAHFDLETGPDRTSLFGSLFPSSLVRQKSLFRWIRGRDA